MKTEAFGTTTFCDDVRHEVNGKLTLIGCYSGELNFTGPPPGLLPTFAALVNIRIPKGITFKSMAVRVLKEEDGDVSTILDLDIDTEEPEIKRAVETASTEATEETVTSITIPLQWIGLPMKTPGFLKVRAYMDGSREIRLGALKVNFQGQPAA